MSIDPERPGFIPREKKIWVGLYDTEGCESGDLSACAAKTGPGVGYEM